MPHVPAYDSFTAIDLLRPDHTPRRRRNRAKIGSPSSLTIFWPAAVEACVTSSLATAAIHISDQSACRFNATADPTSPYAKRNDGTRSVNGSPIVGEDKRLRVSFDRNSAHFEPSTTLSLDWRKIPAWHRLLCRRN
jgi:hypothetical protein